VFSPLERNGLNFLLHSLSPSLPSFPSFSLLPHTRTNTRTHLARMRQVSLISSRAVSILRPVCMEYKIPECNVAGLNKQATASLHLLPSCTPTASVEARGTSRRGCIREDSVRFRYVGWLMTGPFQPYTGKVLVS
jgi:hypothetical protein